MTRRFLDDIRIDMDVLLVPQGETTALEMAALMNDVLDSSVQDECALYCTTPVNNLTATDTWTLLSTIWDAEKAGDNDFLTTDVALGTVTGSSTAGFTYACIGQISVTPDNNEDYEFAILKDGTPVAFVASMTGTGTGDLITINMHATDYSATADSVFTIGVRNAGGSGGTQDLDVEQAQLTVSIQPTNNAN